MSVDAIIDCKFCNAEKSANLHAYFKDSAVYYCVSCNYTFKVNFKESEDEMGKRKNKKRKT
jgi:transposase-like protein